MLLDIDQFLKFYILGYNKKKIISSLADLKIE